MLASISIGIHVGILSASYCKIVQERQRELRQPKADKLVWEVKLHIVVADTLSSTYMCAVTAVSCEDG